MRVGVDTLLKGRRAAALQPGVNFVDIEPQRLAQPINREAAFGNELP